MRSVEIKAIGNNDFEFCPPLWMGYQRFCRMDIPLSVTLRTWARFLSRLEPMHAALATVGEQALGLAHAIFRGSTSTTDEHCYLQDLFGADDARGSGIGRALIEHVHADAKRLAASRVYWLMHKSNPNATQLCDRVDDRSDFIQRRKLLPDQCAA